MGGYRSNDLGAPHPSDAICLWLLRGASAEYVARRLTPTQAILGSRTSHSVHRDSDNSRRFTRIKSHQSCVSAFVMRFAQCVTNVLGRPHAFAVNLEHNVAW